MIAYDGSKRSQAALSDLKYAGLPRLAETKIVYEEYRPRWATSAFRRRAVTEQQVCVNQ
ncbi:MAG TPA: hypothetical protein VJ302_19760 [Blastocatellia bacterium]|nr:hypothetical protein [Blastocatellia bacterium]